MAPEAALQRGRRRFSGSGRPRRADARPPARSLAGADRGRRRRLPPGAARRHRLRSGAPGAARRARARDGPRGLRRRERLLRAGGACARPPLRPGRARRARPGAPERDLSAAGARRAWPPGRARRLRPADPRPTRDHLSAAGSADHRARRPQGRGDARAAGARRITPGALARRPRPRAAGAVARWGIPATGRGEPLSIEDASGRDLAPAATTPAATAKPVLELRGLRRSFGAFEAVRGVDLSVARGQVFGLLGPNGAGKTTTLRMVTGLLRPSGGTIHVGGLDAWRQPLAAKQQIGFIGDRPFLYEKLTGSEFLRFVGGLWGMAPADLEQQAQRWLERFELASWAGEPVEAYSHGMRQRLLLCSALLHRPTLLILDEPMVGLDPRGAARLKQVLRELAEQHALAVVLSTHTLEVVEQVCDALAIIDRGRVIAAGSLAELRSLHAAGGDRLEQIFLRLTEPARAPQADRAAEG
ncbi:MAG: ABC transporter ATP-binding protein [Proteobacteria bacterium]|nr:ABC transporter ATP-binding protein [Pseudomonadota bacterium]